MPHPMRCGPINIGRPVISNPKLVTLLKKGASLAAPDANTFYTADEKGYTDSRSPQD
ncbi:MAG TPA: hypothetical protein VN944_08935 [Nitrospiria bacterium]|nr:hypothetical protein [Nitrospiria bacterium]